MARSHAMDVESRNHRGVRPLREENVVVLSFVWDSSVLASAWSNVFSARQSWAENKLRQPVGMRLKAEVAAWIRINILS